MRDELLKETKQSLEEFFEEDRAGQLRILKISSNDEDRKEFLAQVTKKAEQRFMDALTEMADQLKVKSGDLLRYADVG